MKFLIFAVALLTIGFCQATNEGKYCTAADADSCKKTGGVASSPTCCESSKIAGMEKDGTVLSNKLTDYAWNQIVGSYEHLLLSITFDTYTKDRPGFEKLYRGLSDTAWNKAIDLIKYTTKRGGKFPNDWDYSTKNYSLKYLEPTATNSDAHVMAGPIQKLDKPVSELLSLEQAITVEKALAKTAFALHNEVQSHHKNAVKDLDAGVAHYLEEEFVEYQEDTIRKLVGYHNDFRTILGGEYECTTDKNTQLACFLYDEYLQKQ